MYENKAKKVILNTKEDFSADNCIFSGPGEIDDVNFIQMKRYSIISPSYLPHIKRVAAGGFLDRCLIPGEKFLRDVNI